MESLPIPIRRTLHREIVREKVFCEKLCRTSRQVKIMMPIDLETWNAQEHHQGYYRRETDIFQTIPPRQV
jgi:hypothetical protein